jgi:hypothetical protein
MTPRTYTHAFLLLAAASSVAAQGGRYEPPEETNVFSPPVCQIDENGFFGTIGVVAPVGFNYQIVLDAPDPTATSTIQTRAQSRLLAVSAVEDAISGFVLGTEVFDNLCNRRRLQIKASIRGRRLNAVGVSGNPPDEILPESECKFFLGSGGHFFHHLRRRVSNIFSQIRVTHSQRMARIVSSSTPH